MFKQIILISIVTLGFISCKTKKIVVKDNTPPNTVTINYGDKTGQNKFKVLENKASVKTPVTFQGVGEAYLCTNQGAFEQVFSFEESTKPMPPTDFSTNRVLAIVGQTTEYNTNYTVKSTYQSAEGYTIRIQENQDPNKGSYKMTPYILLEIPKEYFATKFIVYIDQKQLEVKIR